MTHDPIPALKWPDMTMYFSVKPDVNLEEFKVDNQVMFELEKGMDGYVIKSMKVHSDQGDK